MAKKPELTIKVKISLWDILKLKLLGKHTKPEHIDINRNSPSFLAGLEQQ